VLRTTAPDPDLLLGYSRSFTHCKDGPGAARPWWVQGEALAAGGDLAGFSSGQGIGSFLQKRTAFLMVKPSKHFFFLKKKEAKKTFAPLRVL
jgi:hypothetical protein